MSKTDTPAKVASNAQLGLGAEALSLCDRLYQSADAWLPTSDESLEAHCLLEEAAKDIKRLRAALSDAEHRTCQMRIWGGMDWHWHSFHAKAIHDICRQALDKA